MPGEYHQAGLASNNSYQRVNVLNNSVFSDLDTNNQAPQRVHPVFRSYHQTFGQQQNIVRAQIGQSQGPYKATAYNHFGLEQKGLLGDSLSPLSFSSDEHQKSPKDESPFLKQTKLSHGYFTTQNQFYDSQQVLAELKLQRQTDSTKSPGKIGSSIKTTSFVEVRKNLHEACLSLCQTFGLDPKSCEKNNDRQFSLNSIQKAIPNTMPSHK